MACKEDCKGKIVDKRRGIYCQHLEKLLPKISNQSIRAYPSADIDRYSITKIFKNREVPEHEVEWKLRRFGLDSMETELIMLRYIDSKTMLEIVELQGWSGIKQAAYFLKKVLKRLREGRFTLK